MTYQERLAVVRQQAHRLYLRRQQLEAQAQQIRLAMQQADVELVKTDGAIETLEALMKESADGV